MTAGEIRTENLSVHFGDNQILKEVSAFIPAGRITAIIGPSGCGKSTLLRSFNRLTETVENARITGRIFVDKKNILEEENVPAIRKKMGLLLQKPFVFPMSIYDNVAYGLRIHSLSKNLDSQVEKYLRMAHLWDEVKDRLHKDASVLSWGQQQRLCLARGIAVEPEIILADEPTASLDPISSKNIENTFSELRGAFTVIVVTHILRQAKRIADHVIFMYDGRLIESGDSETMFSNPSEKLTRDYVNGAIS